MRRERLFATLRVANAEIQPGNYFGLFDHVDNLARLVGFFIVKSDLRKGHEDRPGTEFLSRPRFAWEWGPRNTRKDAKGDERCGLGAHVTSRDPTLDAVGTRSCAIRRGMSKKRATPIFDLSLRVVRNLR